MKSINTPTDLGKTLRAARKQLGLTQPQLALAAGVGVRFIVDLEAGRDHNCALIEGGNIYCWGNGTDSRFLAQSVDTATTTKRISTRNSARANPTSLACSNHADTATSSICTTRAQRLTV